MLIKIVIGVIVILVILFVASLFKKTIPSDLTETDLSKYQLWCLCLAGVLTNLNGAKYYKLEMFDKDEDYTESCKKNILVDGWGVRDRTDLLDTLDWLSKEGGHNSEYQDYLLVLRDFGDKTTEEMLDEEELDINPYKLDLVRENADQSKHILAWDFGRYAFLCRAGYYVGYLTKEETLDFLQKAGRVVKDQFSSWEEFGNNYALGRQFWGLDDGPEEAAELYNEVKDTCKELSVSTGPWHFVPWSWSDEN